MRNLIGKKFLVIFIWLAGTYIPAINLLLWSGICAIYMIAQGFSDGLSRGRTSWTNRSK